MRDDFTEKTKEKIAKKVGYLCSYPGCGCPTIGSALSHDKPITVGVAAHITAASPSGPRYDSFLTPEQRRDESNGIWVCHTHGKLIDSDSGHFTVEMLQKWKQTAELQAFFALAAPRLTPDHQIASVLPTPVEREPELLGLTPQEYLDSLILHISVAAQNDLATFKRMPGWPHQAIALSLRMTDGDKKQTLKASGLAAAIETFNEIVVIAPPGTGKTTTLLQMAIAVLSQGKSVAVFIPLGEWSSQRDPFFQSILRRHAFNGVQELHLQLIAKHGRLVLFLDGWNELDVESRKYASAEIRMLRREFPDLGIVVSTRRQARDVPISGPRVEIDSLSEDQQLEIARALHGSQGEAILDHAWRTPGIRDLVAIPLYLAALLVNTSGSTLPTTKEEVLRLFINEHERMPEKAEPLHEVVFGFHPKMLEGIAVETTSLATSGASEEQANRVVSQVFHQLLNDGQITSVPQPMKVLDVLVNHHTLVRSGTGTGVISFQHQQIQEWYASLKVESLMKAAATDDQEAKQKLRTDVLNMPAWEEAILFACERMSRADGIGLQAVDSAVLDTIGIDPMLAAEMIYRSSAGVWDEIKEKIIAFVLKWHVANKIDRAVRFMIRTGRSDFAPQIWPLISDPDDQVHLAALRAGGQFRPSVLGSDIEERIAKLPDEVRKNIASSFAFDCDIDGIELAAKLAQVDPCPKVQFSVIEALSFKRADRFVTEVLRTAPDEVWQMLASKGYAEEIVDPEARKRLRRERQHYIEKETDPLGRLRVLLYAGRHGAAFGHEVGAAINDADFSGNQQQTGWIINDAHLLYPDYVISALINRLEDGRGIPFQAEDLLQAAGITIDEGPIVELVMQPGTLEDVTKSAVCIVGPKTVGRLIDSLFVIDAKLRESKWRVDEPTREEYYRLSRWISKTNTVSFIQAVLSRSQTDEPCKIALLADLVSRHGKGEYEEPIKLDGELHDQMIAAIERWAMILLASPESSRAQLADIARAIGRLAAPELLRALQRMLAVDLDRWRRAREEFFAARDRGIPLPVPPDVSHSWTLQYRRSFFAIGGEEVVKLMKAYLSDTEFGFDAACILKDIWDQEHNPLKDKQFTLGPDFSEVKARRLERQEMDSGHRAPSPFAEAIISVIDKLLKPGSNPEDQRRAVQLAKVAFGMPYGNKTVTIETLLKLPQSLYTKQELLTVLVLSGEIISAEMVIEDIKTILEEAKAKKWMSDENRKMLEDWLKLLPFSDRPEATLDALDLLEPNLREPWRLRHLLSALGHAPALEAEHVLKQLPRKDIRILDDYGWLAAIDKRGVSAARILLDLISEGAFDSMPKIKHNRSFSLTLASAMRTNIDFRAEVYQQYESLPVDQGNGILEEAIADAADTNGVLILVHSHAMQGKPYSWILRSAIEQVVTSKRPSINWAGGSEVFSVPAPDLRKRLFELTEDAKAEAYLAAACLTAIDELREDYGPALSEPRHPDIESGRPWPLVATLPCP